MEDFLLRFIADRAGVVEDKAGVLFGFDLPVALLLQRPDHFLGIVGVHLAPEGLKIEGFFGCHGNPKYSSSAILRSTRP